MRVRLVLLTGQTIALGLMMAFLVVPASSLFLAEYGAAGLPYVYLGVAVVGVAVSALVDRAQRRLSLASLSVVLLTAYTAVVIAAWVALTRADAVWTTFALLLLFPLSIPLGFVIVGAQAGRLLHVRQMKAHFPRVVAGFSIGFAIGGLAAAALVDVVGGPVGLLPFDVVAAVLFIVLVILTARRHPAELRSPPPPPVSVETAKPGRSPLLRNRLVLLIFGYQLLSAAVTQLLDYIVWERAAARYPDPSELAQFLGVFGAIINVVSIAFVTLFAGWLLKRYGVGLGLAANPAGVLALVAVSLVIGYAGGPATSLFFVLVCAQQVTDITLTDGTTRTSINSTYQALPVEERLRAQTITEGAGVPLALGAVGAVLIVVNGLGLDVRAVVLITFVLSLAWLLLAVLAFREYGVKLRAALSHRSWDPVALNISDDSSQDAVRRLLASPDLRDVQVGLDVLADAGDPSLGSHVARLLSDADPARRELGVSAVQRSALADQTPAVGALALDTTQPAALRGAAARVAGELGTSTVQALLAHELPEVRLGAAAGLVSAESPAGAQARSVWTAAVGGQDQESVRHALAVAAAVPNPFFASSLLDLADSPSPPPELAEALAANADALVPAAATALANGGPAPMRLLRALASANSVSTRRLLVQLVGSDRRDVAELAVRALVGSGHQMNGDGTRLRSAVTKELERAAHALDAVAALEGPGSTGHLVRALRDEVSSAGERVVGLLALVHDAAGVTRAVARLASPIGQERGLAIEMLEVTLGRTETSVVLALVDPTLDEETRRQQLAPLRTGHLPREQRLRELVHDPNGLWGEPWLRVCALYAMRELMPEEAVDAARGMLDDPEPTVREVAAWASLTD